MFAVQSDLSIGQADGAVSRTAAPALPSPAEPYAALDDARVQSAFSRPAATAGFIESWVVVEGMYCGSCGHIIASRLLTLPGVRAAEVNVAAKRLRVEWDPAQVRLSGIFAQVAALNYRPYPVQRLGADMARRKAQRTAMWRLFVAGFCMMQVMMYAAPAYFSGPDELSADLDLLLKWASWVLSLPVLLFASAPFFRNAWNDVRAARVGMDVPVAVAIAVTFGASSWALFDRSGEVYFDSLTMFVFFLLGGRYLEGRARAKAAESLESLATRLPEVVDRIEDYPACTRTSPTPLQNLLAGEVVRVKAGQAFPGDAMLLEGTTSADESLLTGESRPVSKSPGDRVVAGSYNTGSAVLVRLERLGRESRFGQIVALMERAASEKPALAALADRIARFFLAGVLLLALAAGIGWSFIAPERAVWVAVSVLVVTCPCALSLATPAAILAATGHLARRGVLVCHPRVLENLAQAGRVVFDKTGTLTSERLSLLRVELVREGVTRETALTLASAMEAGSLHPVAKALQAAANELSGSDAPALHDAREHRGDGVEAWCGGERYRLGRPAFAWPGMPADAGVVLADRQGPLAVFAFGENLRPDAALALNDLRALGREVALLSGDRPSAVREVAGRLDIAFAEGGQTPESKLATLSRWQAQERVVAVGDGINDGPLLSRADVSIAMGSGAPLSQSQADLVLLNDRLAEVPHAIRLAQRMQRIVKQNLYWSAGYNLLCVPLALAGLLPPWLAGLGMAASSLFVVANALRLGR